MLLQIVKDFNNVLVRLNNYPLHQFKHLNTWLLHHAKWINHNNFFRMMLSVWINYKKEINMFHYKKICFPR